MKIKVFLSIVVVLIISFLIVPLDFISKTSSNKIRVGINAWPGYEYLYLAKHLGFYEQQGVDVDIIEYMSLEDIRYGFEKNQIDVMSSTVIELILAADRTDKKPKAFFIYDYSLGGDVIIARSEFNKLADLQGKTIAVEPNSLGLYMLSRALQLENLDIGTINIKGMIQPEMANSLKKNKVQAIITYPPFSVNAFALQPDAKVIFDSGNIPGEIIDVATASEEFLNSHKPELKKMLLAWDMAVDYAKNNPEQAYTIMSNREKITLDEFINMINNMQVLKIADQSQHLISNANIYNTLNLSIEALQDMNYIKHDIKSESLICKNILIN